MNELREKYIVESSKKLCTEEIQHYLQMLHKPTQVEKQAGDEVVDEDVKEFISQTKEEHDTFVELVDDTAQRINLEAIAESCVELLIHFNRLDMMIGHSSSVDHQRKLIANCKVFVNRIRKQTSG